MIDLSFISIPIIVIVNAYCFLWIFLSIVYLTPKTKVEDDPSLQDHFVSVILPARNEERVIQNIIADLKTQTYKKLEIIVVAHNCKDRTYERALETSDLGIIPVRVYKLKTEIAGKGLALQYGLKQARGDLIACFDVDNKVPNEFIERMVEWIERGYDAVQASIEAKNPKYNKLTHLIACESNLWSKISMGGKQTLGLNSTLGGTGFIIKKQSLVAVGGFRNMLIDDVDLYIRLSLENFKIAYAENCIIYDEKPTTFKALIKQRSRWIAGQFELIRNCLVELPRLFLKLPIDSLFLFSPLCLFAILISFFLSILNLLFPSIVFLSTPFIYWVCISFLYSFLFSIILKRNNNIPYHKGFAWMFALWLFSLHWFVVLFKSFFINGWSDTKTEHGLIGEKV